MLALASEGDSRAAPPMKLGRHRPSTSPKWFIHGVSEEQIEALKKAVPRLKIGR
jgi:hypothetical protein